MAQNRIGRRGEGQRQRSARASCRVLDAEGENIDVADMWTDAHLQLGREALAGKHPQQALAEFELAPAIPANLPTDGFNLTARAPEVDYWMGEAWSAAGNPAKARESWQRSARAESAPARQGYGELTPLVQSYYQALSLRTLGQTDQATNKLRDLVAGSNQALRQGPVELNPNQSPDALRAQRSSLALAHYAAALGYLGLDEKQDARRELTKALEISPDSVGARSAMEDLK